MRPEELFKGLADPTRLRIALLLGTSELCVCDLMAVLQLPQSTVSRHMGRMKSSGLVRDRRSGKWVHYHLAESSDVSELSAYLERTFAQVEPYRSDRLALRRLVRSGGCARFTLEASTNVGASKRATAKSNR